MRVLIVEDELLAAERLVLLLKEYDPGIRVAGITESIEETVNWLRQHPAPDLLLLDIHLADGHSFDIFKKINYSGPVIFTTAYDRYALDAFKLFSLDYILKPVTKEALATALQKYESVTATMQPDYKKILAALKTETEQRKFRNRFLARVGQRLFFITADEIAYFQADNKIVYLVDKKGNRYVVNYTMEQLEEILDPAEFFRLSRKFIVKMSAIEQVKPYYNNRLKLSVTGAPQQEELVISRERVAGFRQWAEA